MILFIILVLIAIILTILTVIGVSVFGAAALAIFGDVIVCIAIIAFIIAKLVKRNK